MTNKMTYAVALNNAINLTEGETRETLERLLESINKRNASKSSTGKPTKTQRENMEVKAQIVEFLRGSEPVQCGAIATELGLSGQKVSALLRQLCESGEVVKTEGPKRVSLFAIKA